MVMVKDVSKIKIQGSICSLDRYMQYLLITALYLSTETEFSIYEVFGHHCPSVEIKEGKNGSLSNGDVLIVIFTLTYYWCQREPLLATGPDFLRLSTWSILLTILMGVKGPLTPDP